MLFESLRKTLYAGVGMAFMTRDKIEDLARKLAEESKLNEADVKKFIDELLKKSEETKAAFDGAIDKGVTAALERLDLARNRDLKALEARVKALESRAQG
jgi:polyhydroxyalkanoate synthesis regulator phasin